MKAIGPADPTFRVFVTRHYIAVRWYDIQAKSAATAANVAVRHARHASPDVREEATDNGWIADPAVQIGIVGESVQPLPMVLADCYHAGNLVWEPAP